MVSRHLRLRLVPAIACAVAVIAGMLWMAERANREADRAREAQVLMEQVRAASIRVESLTWQSLATTKPDERPDPRTVAAGLDAFHDVTRALRRLHALGRSGETVELVENRVGEAYGSGLPALTASHTDPARARRIGLARFAPAMQRLDRALTVAVERQADVAQSARSRASLGSAGSLAGGLCVLALLGWRVHRARRRAAIAEQGREAEQRLRALVRHSSDIVAVIDPVARVLWIAESIERVLGHRADALTGVSLGELVHADDLPRAEALLRETVREGAPSEQATLRLRTAGGEFRHLEIVGENRIADPLIGGVLLSMRDVSQRLALEDQLRHQAFHDMLTGLSNRALFEDRLAQALARERRRGGTVAVLFVDLDDFKLVNDRLGHAVGDELLQAVARRLETVLRAEDTAARLGGDEFAVLLGDLAGGRQQADLVGQRLLEALSPPIEVRGQSLQVAASVGIALAAPADTPEEILRHADVAMYAAKQDGKRRLAHFEPEMYERVVERLELGRDLESALARGELSLAYQPIVELEGAAMIGVEALLRWQHPRHGAISPDRFIPLAEASGLIVPIGEWVLRTACEQLRRWEAPHLSLSVNVSVRQLADPGFADVVRQVLADTGLAPQRITLELTEGLLADDSAEILDRFKALKALGVRLAVDDFGTGYSALSYLRSFPIDVLKIDRSFMAGVLADEERVRLVRGIVEMARSLQLGIVTEGIEETGQASLMHELRSDFGQGFLFSRPVAPGEIAGFIANGLPKESHA